MQLAIFQLLRPILHCLMVSSLAAPLRLLKKLPAQRFSRRKHFDKALTVPICRTIDVTETGHDDWQLGLTRRRFTKLFLELFICSLCPFPGAGYIKWPLLDASIQMHGSTTIPLPVLLCLPMFLRVYLACRRILLHKRFRRVRSSNECAISA
ncbi:unnamed protein product [Gongylonema pulchrum]|uniref:Secreted protein n=1 Tax=Gongylonema pulchrum TaxID=637853 RepID=A0A183ETC0_9BILA|nr:unnamed protein product [Gongylonema pulchrum]